MAKKDVRVRERPRVTVTFSKPSRVIQSARDECDINNIMRKYERTGLITHVNKATAAYMDVSEVHDYQSALNMVTEAQAAFNRLPSAVRERFGNDPGRFVAFVQDPKNADELLKMGLRTPKEPEPVVKVEVTNPMPPVNPEPKN